MGLRKPLGKYLKIKSNMINEYDAEPVFYCEECHSLAIKSIAGIDYCCRCGSTSIKEAENIFEWEKICQENDDKPN